MSYKKDVGQVGMSIYIISLGGGNLSRAELKVFRAECLVTIHYLKVKRWRCMIMNLLISITELEHISYHSSDAVQSPLEVQNNKAFLGRRHWKPASLRTEYHNVLLFGIVVFIALNE